MFARTIKIKILETLKASESITISLFELTKDKFLVFRCLRPAKEG